MIKNILTYKEIERRFREENYWGLDVNIDLLSCNAALIRSELSIKHFVEKLCDLIKMKRFQETQVVHFGEEDRVAGYSMVQLIETSTIVAHFRNENNNAYIDIFSCKIFDPYKAACLCQQFFEALGISIEINFRK